MKYNLEILSNEKFLINFLFDIFLAIKISLRKYWYLFIFISGVSIYVSNYHFSLQKKVYRLRSTFRLGSILTPQFGTGVITLSNIRTTTKFGRDLLLENFGLKKKDFMSTTQGFLGGGWFST